MRTVESRRFPGYVVSDRGDVFGPSGKLLNGHVDSHGYRRVYPRGSKYVRVHRLVAETFVEQRDGKNTVNHIDGNKLNNAADNLEWVTQAENMRHAYDRGLSPRLGKGEDGLRAILTQKDVEYIRTHCVRRDPVNSMSAMALRFGVSVSCIHLAFHGRNW